MSIKFLEKHNISNLIELSRHRAETQPDKTAYIFLVDGENEEIKLTYGELDKQARAIAANLQKQFQAGDRVLLIYPPGLEFISAFFGCLYAGVVAAPCSSPDPNKLDVSMAKLQCVIDDCAPEIILSVKEFLDLENFISPDYPSLDRMNWLATDEIDVGLSGDWTKPAIDGETPAFLQYTSGSTGDPKGVVISHSNVLYNEEMIKRACRYTDKTVFANWVPLFHDMGLIGNILQPLYLGASSVIMSPVAFLQRPVRWLRAITRYKATTAGGPNFAYDLCVKKIADEELTNLDLSELAVVYNSAEPIRAETLKSFVDTFKVCGLNRNIFYTCYGMAEVTLVASGGLRDEPPVIAYVDKTALQQNQVKYCEAGAKDSKSIVGCGKAMLYQKIIIVDPETKIQCSDNQAGEIWLSGPNVAQGYWNKPELTAETFQACLADTGEGPFLRSGDLGFMKEGELFFAGRLKDLIIIRGKNYYPQDIELSARQNDTNLRPGCGAAFSIEVENEEKLIVVQEVNSKARENLDVEETAKAIRKNVFNKHGLRIREIVLIEAGSIPKTSSGKIQRRLCEQHFLTDNLNVIARSVMGATDNHAEQPESFILKSVRAARDHAEIRQSLLTIYFQEVIADVAEVPTSEIPIDEPIISIESLGIDSFTAVEIVSRIEESLGKLDIELEDFFRGSVGETAKETDRLLAANNFALKPLTERKTFDDGVI